MVGKFPGIFNVEFTSEMEDELDRIEDGELGWQRVLQAFYGPFTKALNAVDVKALVADAHGLKAEELAKERCPKCGGQVELRTGRFGPYFACVNYKAVLRLREVAEEGRVPTGPRRKVPSLRLCDGDQDRAVRRIPCVHPYPDARAPARFRWGMKCPEVRRGRSGRAAHQTRQVVLGLPALPGVWLLYLESSGSGDLSLLRLAGYGKENQQGRGRDAEVPQVWAPARGGRARGGRSGVTVTPRANVTVVGGGLAGSEAAWALAERGFQVTLYEMRPGTRTAAHQTDRLAEIVCSNSFKSVDLDQRARPAQGRASSVGQCPPSRGR